MGLLADNEIRKSVGILPPTQNKFIFANTGSSIYHIIGWNAINQLCKEADVQEPQLLTASKQRHRVSTLYASLDVPEQDRELFFSHMGHSGDVNRGIYQ